MVIVYEVLSPSNKRYFGITCDTLKVRKSSHFSKANSTSKYPFHKAIRKYGDKLIWRIHSIVDTWEEACELEKLLIAGFNTCVFMFNSKGYNATFGGEGTPGRKHKKSSKQKISKAKKGVKRSDDLKRKLKEANTGKITSQETKKKISISTLGKTKSKKHRKNISKGRVGIQFSKETKNKMSKSRMGIKLSKETKLKMLRKYHIINPEGVEFCIIGLKQFCIDNDLNFKYMVKVSSGYIKHHKGFKCYKII